MRAQGFERDPADSAVAQRFAREVLARDEIIREDEPKTPEAQPTDADAEIDCMVAIPVYLHDRFQGVVICANRDGGFAELDDDLLLALGDHAGARCTATACTMRRRESRRARGADARRRHPGPRPAAAELCRPGGRPRPRPRRPSGARSGRARVARGAALLRDVGNLAITDGLLFKPGPLTPEERAVIELHPRIGFDIVGRFPALRDAASRCSTTTSASTAVATRPARGRRIPRLARVLAVADAYEAMVQDRP